MSLKEEILKYSRQDTMTSLSPWFDNQLEQLINQGIYCDVNVLEDTGRKLVSELIAYGTKYNIRTVVLGMSGGVDSALTAALFKAAGWRVVGVTMPIHQNPEETDRGLEACRVLSINHVHVDLTQTYDDLKSAVKEYDDKIDDADHVLRRGNLRVRLRMMTVYNIASSEKGLVGSTDNFSELAAGFWTLHGDVGDLAPIQSLLKSWEVPRLAEIYGVPKSTVFARPTDGLGISDGDEAQFGFSYLQFDIILMKLCHIQVNGTREDILAALEVPDSELPVINKILDRIKYSSFKRQNPYNLTHPQDINRYPGLSKTDLNLWM